MSVQIILGNGSIGGTIATADKTAGLLITCATEGTVTAGTPFLLTTANDVAALGLTTATNPLAVKVLNEIVAELQAQGVNTFALFVMPLASTVTIAQMVDLAQTNNAVKLVNYANGRIKLLCAITAASSPTVTAGINGDCYTAITNLHALCNSYAELPKNWPMRGMIACTHFSGVVADLTDLTQNTTNRVMAFIGDTVSGNGCAVGVALGRWMAIPVQRKISRVLDGPVSNTTAFIGTVAADQFTGTATIESKGFVTFKSITGNNGFFFTSDQTASKTTDDYHFLCRGCVVDKAHSILVAVFNLETDNEVDTNADGTIDANSAKQLQTSGKRNIDRNMTANKNITSCTVNVDATQNVQATSQVNMQCKLQGKGYTSKFVIQLGY